MLKLNSTGKSFGRRKMQVAARKHRRHQFETLEKRMLLAGDVSSAFHADSVPEYRLHNVSLPADVDASGQVSALDALMIINRIGRENISIDAGSKQAGTGADSAFYDVNNDRAVTALDALVVINSLQLAALPLEAETAAFTPDMTGVMRVGSVGNTYNEWFFDLDGNGGLPEADRLYGLSTHTTAVSGDWDGDGDTDMGIVYPENGFNRWLLDTNGDTLPDKSFVFGFATDTPVTGDWNNDGVTTVGVVREAGGFNEWYLDTNFDPDPEIGPFIFGLAGDTPVIGDWNNDGTTNVGAVRSESGFLTWYLDTNFDPNPEEPSFIFGVVGDSPITGDWNGDGLTDAGVTRPEGGFLNWYLDTNRDPLGEVDLPVRTFGLIGDIPISGNWGFAEFAAPDLPVRITLGDGVNAPASAQIEIYNNGNRELLISQATVPNGFHLSQLPTDIVPGSSATMEVTLVDTEGYQFGALSFTVNDGGESPVEVSLTEYSPGGGVRPVPPQDIEVDVPHDGTLEFSNVAVGTLRREWIQITNTGSQVLKITSIESDSTDFLVAPLRAVQHIQPRHVREFSIDVNSATIGPKTGTLTIQSDDPDENPYEFQLAANVAVAAPKIEVFSEDRTPVDSGDTIVFQQRTGGPSQPNARRFIKVRNVGNTLLRISSVTLTENTTNYYRVISFDRVIAPMDDGDIEVWLQSGNDRTATLTITSNDTGPSPFVVQLETQLVNDQPGYIVVDEFNGGAIRLPQVGVGETSETTLTVRNGGGTPVIVTGAIVTGPFSLPDLPFESPRAFNPNKPPFRFTVQTDTSILGEKEGTLRLVTSAGQITIPLVAKVQSSLITDEFLVAGAHGFSVNDVVRITRFSDGRVETDIALRGRAIGLGAGIDALTVVGNEYILSTSRGSSLGGQLSFGRNDLLGYDPTTGRWRKVFDHEKSPLFAFGNISGVAALDSQRVVVALDGDAELSGPPFPRRIAYANSLYVLNVATGGFSRYFDGAQRGLDAGFTAYDAVDLGFGATVSATRTVSHGPNGQHWTNSPAEDAFSLDDGRTLFDGTRFGVGNFSAIHILQSSIQHASATSLSTKRTDWSDAPDMYGAASHLVINGGPVLGEFVDAESLPQLSDNARGDDTNLIFAGLPADFEPRTGKYLGGGDEDGVLGSLEFTAGTSQNVSISLGDAQGIIQAWIDFNGDGDWDDPGEDVIESPMLSPGSHEFTVNVPTDAASGVTFARFRVSSAGGLAPEGSADDGEVEDYSVTVFDFFDVINTSPDGPGSLRQAILEANQATNDSVIRFAIPQNDSGFLDVDNAVAGGDPTPDVFRIQPTTALPGLNNVNGQEITIDGASQQTLTGDTNEFGPEIEINGDLAGLGANGLIVESDNVEVRGLTINGFLSRGIAVLGDGAVISDSYLGTDATGIVAAGNSNGIVVDSADNVRIGPGNVVSGNQFEGIYITNGSSNVTVSGSKIGTNASGTMAIPNLLDGVHVDGGSTLVTIGGTLNSDHNTISGNGDDGVEFRQAATSSNHLLGNRIGTDRSGTTAIPNGSNGIRIDGSTNTIVGPDNVISGNAQYGVTVGGGADGTTILGNRIGTDSTGMLALPNTSSGILVGVHNAATNTTIGGTDIGARNIISGNGLNGISAFGSGVIGLSILNNFIGLNAAGDAAVPNGGNGDSQGIRLEMGVSNVTIGAPGAGNVISGNLSNGIGDTFVQDITIQSNFIGTDATGTFAIPNQGAGISFSDARNVLLGGADPSERNVISGNRSPSNNGNGISLGGSDLRVIGNYIGTDITGTIDIGNIGEGISVGNAVNVQIGGSNPGEGNVVSANGRSGINLWNSDKVHVVGNFVGTSADGSQDLGNTGRGILAPHGSTDVLIEDNLASGNGDHGIHSWDGVNHTIRNNRVGTTADGTAAIANDGFGVFIESTATAIVDGNLISGNANSGIRVIDQSRSIEPTQWLVSEGGNGRFYLETPLLSWTDAEAMAVALGGHLADITDQAENDFLTQTFVNDRRSWIGLNDADTEGTFVWSSGEVFDPGVFESFDAAEPNGGARENYVELFSPGQWNDASNSSDKPGIMEFQTAPDMNLIQSLLASITVNGNQIGTNALGDMAIPNHSGIAVSLLGSTKLTIVDNQISGNTTDGIKVFGDAFVPAQITRNNIGTTADGLNVLANGRPGIHLASASNIEVTDNVSVGSSASSGLIIDESREISARDNYLGVASDGVTAMPNDAFGLFVLRSYDLDIVDNVISGNRLSGVRIQESAFDPILTQWSVADGGNDNWYWITPDQRTWDHSEALAQSLGANLVTVNSEQENMFITDTLLPLVSRGGTAWNGFNDVASDGSFVWSSEEPVTYSKWAANEPSGGTSENYVYFAADGSWKTWGVGVDVAIIEFTTQPDPTAIIDAYGTIDFTGNFIGVGSDGTSPVPNADGFDISDSSNVVIGGPNAVDANLIAHNTADGVHIRREANVTVTGNSIYSNGSLGIDLAPQGVTPNDSDDSGHGTERSAKFPDADECFL